MKRGESMRSRGYTLIEIAGVMVVLGILLGASLLPLNRQLREFEYRQERANMERLRDAVVGYALRHRTPGVGITMVDDMRGTEERGFYAAGHPYLPCPDGDDGNGIEDRRNLISPVVQTLRLSFKDATPRSGDRTRRQQELLDSGVDLFDLPFIPQQGFSAAPPFNFPYPIIESGSCRTDKGQLPWRTLGSIPADYWGNRYTYFADPVFSREAIGFDEKTIADSGVRFLPRVLTTTSVYIPQKRHNGTRFRNRIFLGPPSVICDIAEAAEDSLDCGRNGVVAAPATLVAGEPAPTDGDGVFLTRDDIADGLPFVIVSHGHNGRGAYNHLLSRREDKLECRSFDGISVGEGVNLHIFVSLEERDIEELQMPSGMDFEFNRLCHLGVPDSPIRDLFFNIPNHRELIQKEGYFFAHRNDVSAARAASSLSDRKGMDDLLVWMTRADLARRMSEAQVFPLIVNDRDRPPIFYEPP